MSVSYHLVPVDKGAESFIDMYSFDSNINNGFSIFAELMINYPNEFLEYFDKHELFFDFVFCLKQTEVSKITYQPDNLKTLFQELLDILNTKENFPIKVFNYFKYEDIMESTFLYINLKGSELNKIIENQSYHGDSDFEIKISFDKWNNYAYQNGSFIQKPTYVHIKSTEGDRFHANLNLNAFPSKLKINGTLSNINLGKEIKEVSLVLKTPYEHLQPIFTNLIKLCDACKEKGYGIKSFISC